MADMDQELEDAVAAAVVEETQKPEGYERPPGEQVAQAVRSLRAHSIHCDTTAHLLRAQEQALTATEQELRRKAEELIAEHKDCQRALGIVRQNIKQLTQ